MALSVVVTGSTTTELAHPRDMVTIKEGTPYTVPTGKIFTLTGVGRTNVPSAAVTLCDFLVDDVSVLRAGIVGAAMATIQAGSRFYTQVCSIAEVPFGITVAAGHVCKVDDKGVNSLGRAYGFLSDD